jgi:hypothetical protein
MAANLLSGFSEHGLRAPPLGRRECPQKETAMKTLLGALAIIVAFLFAAPIIESGTSGATQVFQAIGTAEGGGGGW